MKTKMDRNYNKSVKNVRKARIKGTNLEIYLWTKGHTKCYILVKVKNDTKRGCWTMHAKYTASQIATWFLAYNNIEIAENGAEPISNLKLQKLLYYAQGTYLGITGRKLFDDPIVAWKHGPVVESVYHRYKENGSNGIPFEQDFDFKSFDKETFKILEDVYSNFGQFSAWKLREMSHNERPWKETEQSEEISPQLIKSFFEEEYIEQ